jgi:hypothetical protein
MTATGRRVYDSTIPTITQPDTFSCSISSATWCLRSVGIDVTEPMMRRLMIPGLVSEDLGLLDGSGGALARLFREQFGLRAQNQREISFEEVAERAGRQPLAIGGHRWAQVGGQMVGHWVAVRRFENGELVLANPGGDGPKFGQKRLDDTAFDRRGFFSAVWIEVDEVAGGRTGGNADGEPGRGSGLPLVAPVAEIPFEAAGRFRVVRADGRGVIVRERPFQEGGRRGGVLENTVVEGADLAWRLVRTEDGVTGWAAAAYLDREDDRLRVVRTEGRGVLIRPQPYRDGRSLGGVLEGGLVSGVEEHAFRLVRAPEGTVGWVPDTYLDPAD